MSKKSRTILICVLISLFFLITPILILYSQGYRFDFNPPDGGIKITQTGGLFLKASPKNVEVFLDGRLEEKTSFFFGSVYINNLLPKKYNIQVQKEGYNVWEKNLEVKEKEVAEAKNIILIPKNLELQILNKGVEDFWILSENKIILKESAFAEASADKDEWALKIFNLENNLKSHLISEKEISKKEPELLELKISPNGERVILKIGLKEQLEHFILDLTESPNKLISLDSLILEPDIEKLDFHPEEPSIIFYFKDGDLFEADLSKRAENGSQCVLKGLLTYKILENSIYYIDESGYIFKNNLSFEFEEKMSNSPFSLKQETKYELKVEQGFIFILEDKNLYLFNPETKNFEKIFEPVKEIKISPDAKKILYFNEHEIWILFLEAQTEQPRKEALSKQFLTRFSEKIDDVFWFNPHYLIFNLESKIKVIEIDERDKINDYDLCSEIKKLNWDNKNKNLYLLTEENVLQFSSLTYF
ncbi:hypothetical protein KAU51_01650 [Candidatus Parcubacteria bacterium]|nr:hypothetical protein [Candidatus Parcubacteria bacterium]